MTQLDFSCLKEEVVKTIANSDNHNDLLHSLKELFRGDINSIRRFEKISTIGQLLNILELRGQLSEDSVDPIKKIAKKINNSELLLKVNEYESSHVSREGSYYVSEKENKTSSEIPSNFIPLDFNMNMKKDRIIRTVSEEIGSFWRDLARSLKIRECRIDEIDSDNKNLATKAFKMMELFYSKADKQKWFFTLSDSLAKIHRRDLVNTIQEIMMINKM